MPVRIYALAKDLDLDSKDLVEVCRKAGLPGKGSALASLTDEEVAKVKAYLAGDQKKKPQQQPPPLAPTRPAAPVRLGPPPRLSTLPHRTGPLTRQEPPEQPAVDEPLAEPPAQPEPEAPAAPPAPMAPAASTPAVPPPAAPARSETYTRGDYLSPGYSGKIRVLGGGGRKSPAEKKPGDASEPPRVPKKREAVIKLADAPDVKQPLPPVKPDEPKAQKPDIRLPRDVISGHKAGQRAPLEHLTKAAEQAPKKPAEKKKGDKRAAAPAAGSGAPLSVKGSGKRRNLPVVEEEKPARGLAGMASARADRQKTRKATKLRPRPATAGGEEDRDGRRPSRRPRTLTRRRNVNTAAPRKENAVLELPCTVRSFSEAAGVSAGQVLKTLMGLGMALSINAALNRETAELLAVELGVDIDFRQPATLEDSVVESIEGSEDSPESLVPRPPIVTFLGHVDHGKTSLLDRIIGTDVVSREAGGITQHIRAYQIDKDGRKISFVDTPGHEAFTEMRARGANVTDIAVLVVAAEDGVMPQTEEAISHARAAGVPIIVAMNKIDLPGADPARVIQQLAAQNLLPSEWGGDVEVIRTSATTGQGVDDLLETILMTAEMNEYKANPDRSAVGVCLESEQQAGRGVVAKLIVQKGTLKVGDIIVCGESYGRVKAMQDTLRTSQRLKKAGPSTPVNVTGLDTAPGAGDRFHVLTDISQAREIAEQRANRHRQLSLAGITTRVSFEEFQRRLSEGSLANADNVVTLHLIIRADVRGSIEAIEKELSKLDHPEVQVKVLHKSVGAITAADVMLAHASEAVVVGFNVIPDEAARSLADEKQVEIRRYDVIYKMTDDIRALLEGKLKPEERVVELGHALVKRVFPISRVGVVAGCYVVRGSLQRGCRIRVSRDGRIIGDYEMDSLRREKDDTKEVPRGMECGVKLVGFNDIKQDDVLEAYRIEEVARSF